MMAYSILHLNEVHPLPHPNPPLVKVREPDFSCFPPLQGGIKGNTARLSPKKHSEVGWVEERNPTFSGHCWVSLRSTQPTNLLNRAVLGLRGVIM